MRKFLWTQRKMMFFFFFQAEDGIRDADVTGVQTCALPISRPIGLQRLQVFDQIRFLRVRQSESQDAVVVLDDVRERRGAAIMEIRWVLRQGPERRGPVLMVL